MNKLVVLLRSGRSSLLSANSNKQAYLLRSLITVSSSKTNPSSLVLVGFKNSSRRNLASESNKQVTKETPNNLQNEWDKPEWERSTRYRIFYGFDYKNEAADKALVHFYTFIGVFGFFFMPLFLIYYYPDYKTNDWCYREAALELARREASGEPLVSPDYVPPERINLPTDEELGDTEIII